MYRIIPGFLLLIAACSSPSEPKHPESFTDADSTKSERIAPAVITQTVPHDSDDPAIWVNAQDPSRSLILGTDKDTLGGIYVFDLEGRLLPEKTVYPVARPNNIDLEYGFPLGERAVDIAVFTERYTESIRVISVPDMQYIDGGGIPVFTGEEPADFRAPMGISLYKEPQSNRFFAIVSRKAGPTDGTYLWQYELQVQDDSLVTGKLVRTFGKYAGGSEIEALVVDDAQGYLYYSDEATGVRKYYVHPDSSTLELALFGTDTFAEDREGIALLKENRDGGYIVVSDQQAHQFLLFPRAGHSMNPHNHPVVGSWNTSTIETDGCEIVSDSLSPRFPKGIFVAMSEGGIFHYYDLRDLNVPE